MCMVSSLLFGFQRNGGASSTQSLPQRRRSATRLWPSMDAPELVRKYSEVSRSLSKGEMEECQKFVEVCKTLLRIEATEALNQNPESVNLLQYSCDCTPLRVRKHYSVEGPCGSSRASSQETTDYFVQQVLTSVTAQQSWQDRLIYREPIPLKFGKTMASLAACTSQFLKGQWCVGTPSGITIHHQIHDRGITKSFRDAVAGHLATLVSQDQALGDAEATHEALHFHTEASCCLHDAHNAFRWGFQSVMGDKMEQTLADLYMAINSYRTSVAKCLPCVPAWLDRVLTPLPLNELPSEEELTRLYSAVGVGSDLLDALSSEMHLIWRPADGKLLVLDTFLTQPTAVETLSNTLLGVWKFPAFCASRWITVGTSCRTLVQGLLTGYARLFSYMISTGKLSEHDSQGGLRLTPEVTGACLIAGLTAYVAETFTSMAMTDPRLLRQLDALEEAVLDELRYLENLQPSVWIHLASLCQCRGWFLRHRVISGALASASHLQIRIFAELSSLPWMLLRQGSPEQVLQEIENLDQTSPDPVIQKLQHLNSIKYSRGSLLVAIELLQCVSFSSHFTERQHASTATLKRRHDYSNASLCPRAFVHTFRSRDCA